MVRFFIHIMKLIQFEDNGQDFTRWLVDKKGKVVACAPFQQGVWTQGTVRNLDVLKVGDQVAWHKPGEQIMFIKYPVVKIEDVMTAEELTKQHGRRLMKCFVLTVPQGKYPGGVTQVLRCSARLATKFECVVAWDDNKEGHSLTPMTPVHFIGKP